MTDGNPGLRTLGLLAPGSHGSLTAILNSALNWSNFCNPAKFLHVSAVMSDVPLVQGVFKASRDIPLVGGAMIVGGGIYLAIVLGLRALLKRRNPD